MSERLAPMPAAALVAGLMYLVLAAIIKTVGVHRVMRFLPPVVTGPIIICIGLTLAPSAVSNASNNWFLAIVALAVIIIFNIWGKGMFKIIPILFGCSDFLWRRAGDAFHGDDESRWYGYSEFY